MGSFRSKLTVNYLYNLALQVFNMLVPLITTPYISRVLGAKMIGIYSYTMSISTYFIVAGSLGFPLYGQREIAYCANSRKERSKKFFEIIYAQLFLLLIALSMYYCFVFMSNPKYKNVYLAQSVGIMGGVLATSWFYIGIEEFKVTVAKNFFVKIFSVIGLLVFVKKPQDVALYAVIVGMANLLGNLAILIDIKKYVDLSFYRISLKRILRHVKPAFVLGIPYYITSVYAIIDKTMLGVLGAGYEEVGYYEQAQKIVIFIIAIVTSIGGVLMPRLANEFGNENYKMVKQYMNKGMGYCSFLATPIMFGLISVSTMMVPWFFGEGYNKVGTLLKLFAPMAIFMGLSNLVGTQYMVISKKERQLIISILIGAIINCVINAILIPYYNSYGAAIATLISEGIKLIIQIWMIRDILDIWKLLRMNVYYMCLGIIMLFGVMFLRNNFFIKATITNTIIIVFGGGVMYVGMLLITKDSLFYHIIKKVGDNF